MEPPVSWPYPQSDLKLLQQWTDPPVLIRGLLHSPPSISGSDSDELKFQPLDFLKKALEIGIIPIITWVERN